MRGPCGVIRARFPGLAVAVADPRAVVGLGSVAAAQTWPTRRSPLYVFTFRIPVFKLRRSGCSR